MKNLHFFLKTTSLVLIFAAVLLYQSAAKTRADLISANEKAVSDTEEYNRNIQKQEAELQAAIKKIESEKAGIEYTEPEVITYYLDGTYEGTAAGFGGPVTVSVIIENDTILKIEEISHVFEDPAYYESARKILTEIVNNQILDVDTVSGATFSSAGLIQAVNDALTKAVRD